MGSSGKNSVQADAFWGGHFLGEYLFLEKNIPDLGFLCLSNAIYILPFTWNYLEKPWKPTENHENHDTTLKTMETNQKPWIYLEKP